MMIGLRELMDRLKTPTWDYRVLRTHIDDGLATYTIHEVYYGVGGKAGAATSAVLPSGLSLKELRECNLKMSEAIERPVLESISLREIHDPPSPAAAALVIIRQMSKDVVDAGATAVRRVVKETVKKTKRYRNSRYNRE